ncbi:MAG TPA: DUF6270 domain-containing protein [Chitinophagaceae bacterium]|nr:DUF6270 domain-containing protein [Chitinophagaceae bacterium]
MNAPNKYITILGSCSSADAFRTEGWPAFLDAGLRVSAYEGRTGFISIQSEPFASHEFSNSAAFNETHAADWGYRMTVSELKKEQLPRLRQAVLYADLLVVDVVSMFMFPHLFCRATGRVILESWEFRQCLQMNIPMNRVMLWEIPAERSVAAMRKCLGLFRERKPALPIVFHAVPACLNDGVYFKTPELNAQLDYYARFNDQMAEACARYFNATVMQPRQSVCQADPEHPYGMNPFHFICDYYEELRRMIRMHLGLTRETLRV